MTTLFNHSTYHNFFLILLTVYFFFSIQRRPQVDLKEFSFLKKIFAKTKPEKRTWAKLVTLDTIHWYCDEPQPTTAAIKYDARIRQRKFVVLIFVLWVWIFSNHLNPSTYTKMDDAKRREMIKSQAAKKKESSDVDPKGRARVTRP